MDIIFMIISLTLLLLCVIYMFRINDNKLLFTPIILIVFNYWFYFISGFYPISRLGWVDFPWLILGCVISTVVLILVGYKLHFIREVKLKSKTWLIIVFVLSFIYFVLLEWLYFQHPLFV